MHSSTLLTSVLTVGALALPNQLDKRQQVTVHEIITVTVTVIDDPYTTPAWTPPQFSQTPTSNRPTNAPPPWTPSQVATISKAENLTPLKTSSATSTTSRAASSSIDTRPSFSFVVDSRLSSSSVNAARAPSSAVPISVPSAAPDSGHISSGSQAYLSVGAEYQRAILYHHNAARANHNADPLVWDDTCAQTAALAANTCRFEHYIPDGANQGQNLFTTSGDAFNATAGITESWYKGEFQAMRPYFGQSDIPDDVFHDVGHLTQVLWKGTTKVGCVSLDCGTNMIVGGQTSKLNKYTVCNYAPAGNVGTLYAINVGFPKSTTTLGSWND